MKRFSQRIGAVEVPTVMQMECMSDALRNSIWNLISRLFEALHWIEPAKYCAQFFFKVPLQDVPRYESRVTAWLHNQIRALEWYDVYDFAEFVADEYQNLRASDISWKVVIQEDFNRIFQEELSGYRFIGGELAPISGPAEIAAIEGALSITATGGLAGAHAHIAAALQLLGKRPDPDYRNSIKESISAVEAIAKQLGTADSQGLTGALRKWHGLPPPSTASDVPDWRLRSTNRERGGSRDGD